VFVDTFTGAISEGSFALQFNRGSSGSVDGFAVATTMVRPVQFRRCRPAPARDRGPIAVGCETRSLEHAW
jgi:hypothetical protein